jgi:hypothetical protein
MTLSRVISGGQSGADIAGLRAAKFVGIATGGSAAKGWLVEAEDGREHIPAPWLKTGFGLVECQQGATIAARYVARRRANVFASDGTLLFFKEWTPGTKGVLHDLRETQKPVALILARPEAFDRDNPFRDYLTEFGCFFSARAPEEAADWIRREEISTLNIAGPRKSKAPKIEDFAFEYLCQVFQLIKQAATA